MSTVAGLLLIVWCMFEITCWYVHLLNAILSHWCAVLLVTMDLGMLLARAKQKRNNNRWLCYLSFNSYLLRTNENRNFFLETLGYHINLLVVNIEAFFRVKSSVFPRDFTSMVRSNQGSISRPSGSLVSKDVCYKTSIRRTTTRKPWLAAYCCICWPKALHWYISPTFSTLSSNRRVTKVDQKEIYNFTFLRKESENCCVYAGVNCQGF